MFKKLMVNSFIFGITPQIAKITTLFAMPFITLYLTDEDFGKYGVIISIVSALSIFQSLGFHIILINTFIKHPNHYKLKWRYIYGLLQTWMAIYAILQGIFYYFYFQNYQEDIVQILITLIVPSILFGPVSNLGNTYYILKQKSKPIGIRALIFGNLTVGLNLLFIVYYEMGYLGWLWTNFVVTILLNASYWPLINLKLKITPLFVWKKAMIIKDLKLTLPTLPHTFSNYLMGSATITVMDIRKFSENKIGRYSAASMLSGYGDIFVGSLTTAFNPFVMKLYAENKHEKAKHTLYLMQFVVYLATFTAAMWSKEIVGLLISSKTLMDIYPIFIILVMASNYRPMYLASSNMFYFHENTKRLWKITFIAGLFFVILVYFLAPIYDIIGVAILYFLVMQYVGQIAFYMDEYKNYTKVNYAHLRLLLITIVLTAIAYYSVDADLNLRILLYLPISTIIGYFIYKESLHLKAS